MDDANKNKVATALQAKIQNMVCPMCHHTKFTLVDGCFANVIQENLPTLSLDGKFIPTVSIICGNCGFISQHAAGVLNVMDEIKKKEE